MHRDCCRYLANQVSSDEVQSSLPHPAPLLFGSPRGFKPAHHAARPLGTMALLDSARVGFVGFGSRATPDRAQTSFACWIFVGFRGRLNIRSHVESHRKWALTKVFCVVGGDGFERGPVQVRGEKTQRTQSPCRITATLWPDLVVASTSTSGLPIIVSVCTPETLMPLSSRCPSGGSSAKTCSTAAPHAM
jgi:hypothetical protein